MRRRSHAGFTLFIVVIVLTLMGMFLAVLANTSKNYGGEFVEKLLTSNCRSLLQAVLPGPIKIMIKLPVPARDLCLNWTQAISAGEMPHAM